MIKLFALDKRGPGISRQEFNRRWLKAHTILSTKTLHIFFDEQIVIEGPDDDAPGQAERQ
jgi:hypothetical protein